MRLSMKLSQENSILKTNFGGDGSLNADLGQVTRISGSDYPAWPGSYTVTPAAQARTVQTRNYRMTADMTVEAIPYAEVSNTAGGTTVTIGGT